MTLAEAFAAQGYEIAREWTRDTGEAALLLKPPSVPADLAAVSAIITGAGAVSADGYPAWMPLRKLVFVVTTAP